MAWSGHSPPTVTLGPTAGTVLPAWRTPVTPRSCGSNHLEGPRPQVLAMFPDFHVLHMYEVLGDLISKKKTEVDEKKYRKRLKGLACNYSMNPNSMKIISQ